MAVGLKLAGTRSRGRPKPGFRPRRGSPRPETRSPAAAGRKPVHRLARRMSRAPRLVRRRESAWRTSQFGCAPSPTTPMCSVNAMPVWSMAKPCHTRLAPRPGSAKALVRWIGNALGLGQAGRIDHRADHRVGPLRPRVGRWPRRRSGVWSSSCRGAGVGRGLADSVVHTRLGRVSWQDWPMSSVLRNPSHADP